MKKLLSFALSAVLICTAFTLPASAASDTANNTVIERVIGALGIR